MSASQPPGTAFSPTTTRRGILLGGALFGCVLWWFVDLGLLDLNATGVLTWLVLLVLSFILAAGMSWSHIRRRLTGQFDVDEKDV